MITEDVAIGDEFRVTVDSLGFGGVGVARHERGFVCLVANTLPGESVRVRVRRLKRRHVIADCLEVVTPSPLRVKPPCPVFESCGGCHYQHLAYTDQVNMKRDQFLEQATRANIVLGDVSMVAADPPLGYRNRNTFHVRDHNIGFINPSDQSLTALDSCLCAPDRANDTLKVIHAWLKSHPDKEFANCILDVLIRSEGTSTMVVLVMEEAFEQNWHRQVNPKKSWHLDCLFEDAQAESLFINFKKRDSKVSFGDRFVHVLGDSYFNQSIGRFKLKLSPTSFVQIHSNQAVGLYEEAREQLKGETNHTCLDLYSGTGSLACYLAERFHHVLGVELNRQSVLDAQESAQANGIDNVAFRTGKCETLISKLYRKGFRAKYASLNPPRSGCHEKVLKGLPDLGVEHFTYISCSPPTWRRDVKKLEILGYRLNTVKLFDMFPQTYHLEVVSSFSRVVR